MEKSVFENHIKKEIDAYAVAPKAALWDRLEAVIKGEKVLAKESLGSKNFRFLYHFSAAAVVIVLLSVFYIVNQNNGIQESLEIPTDVSPVNKLQLVFRPELKVEKIENTIVAPTILSPKILVASPILVSTKTVNHRASKQPIKRDGLNEVNTPLEEQVEMAHITTAMLLKEDTDPIFLRISQESAVLLAAAEANLLLREVMKGERDLTEKRIQDIQNTISASDLLLEAEIDLNKSFRFKVIQELKENIIKVSQSMASRNQ
jgi:hypothetical protein